MKQNPDDRRDNVEKIQKSIHNTIENIEAAEETAEFADNHKAKKEIEAKNDRRREAIKGMRHEVKDEAAHKKK